MVPSKFTRLVALVFGLGALSACREDATEPPFEPPPEPSLVISTRDTVIALPSVRGVQVHFQARVVALNPQMTGWFVNGTDTGSRGATFERLFNVGTHLVCARNADRESCIELKVRIPDLTIVWYLARSVGSEIISGRTVSIASVGTGAQGQNTLWTSGVMFESRIILPLPQDTSEIEVCLDMAGIYPRCVRLAGEELLQRQYVLSVEERWTITRGSYIGQTSEIPIMRGFENSGNCSIVDPSRRVPCSFFSGIQGPLSHFHSSLPVRVFLEMPPGASVSSTAIVVERIRGAFARLGMREPIFVTDTAGIGNCDIVHVRHHPTRAFGGPFVCRSSAFVRGGWVAMPLDRLDADNPMLGQRLATLEHEIGHVVALYHTESWETVMNVAMDRNARPRQFIADDVALIHKRERIFELLDKYPPLRRNGGHLIPAPLFDWGVFW
jgi:hypothetical protein